MLDVEMSFDMSRLRIRSTESITYTPVITGSDNQYMLPKLIVKGSNRFKADRREEALSGRISEMAVYQELNTNNPVYAIEKFNKNKLIAYRVSVAYQDWMRDATVNLREETCGCGGEQAMMTQRAIRFDGDSNNSAELQPKFNFLTPERELEKNRFDIGNAYLEFAQGGSTINPGFHNNQSELDKINQMISTILSDPDVSLTHIEMRGYASPEGSAQTNHDLSSQRARALRDYFVRRLPQLSAPNIITGVGGEDWEGLKNLLTNYYVDFKEEIFNIINTVQDLDARERRIQQLGGGEPYRQIYRDLYPKLRRVDCQINYTARNFSVEEGKERMLQKAKLLSLYEMFMIARSYPSESHEFYQTLITARQYFPDNDIANLNAAAAALSQENPALADGFLKQVKNTYMPEYANCMGVLNIYKGNYTAAEDFLRRAQDAGVTEATHNMRELQKRKNR